jgi:hypothetical protein
MNTIKWMIGFLTYMFLAISASAATAPDTSGTEPVVVGRIYDVEGDLLRYVPDTNDWVDVVKDAPFSVGDTLYSGDNGNTEMIVPNGSWIRIGNNTQVQVIALDSDSAEIDVASGMARFYNKGTNTAIKVTSPFGYVLSYPGSVFDFYVGDNSVEVISIKGTVSFVHSPDNSRYDVKEGSTSILADQNAVSTDDGKPNPNWDQWNRDRDSFWASKLNSPGRSAEFLPPSLSYGAYELDDYGTWVLIPYDGRDCWFWRPASVYPGWSPFEMGYWSVWYGDECWIPGEPFGYVTHHYGNWVYIDNFWCWAPPVVSVRIGFPLLDVGFWWCPGRVTWVHRGTYVGWVPLAPHETFYSHHNWGGRYHEVVTRDNVDRIHISPRDYRYVDHAVIVDQNNFYTRDNYRNVRVANLHPSVIREYTGAPEVDDTVIRDYSKNDKRYYYTDRVTQEKPHSSVLTRVKQNEATISRINKQDAETLKRQVQNANEGKINKTARIETPRATNYLVPAKDVALPKAEVKFQQREIKVRQTAVPSVITRTKQQTQTGQPTAQPERVAPVTPTQQQKSVTQPAPARTGEAERPAAQPKSTTPERPAVQPGRVVVPATPTQQGKPTEQPEKQVTQPKSVITPKSPEVEKPVLPGRVVVPATPTQQERTPARQEEQTTQPKVVTPSRPGEVERPNTQFNRTGTPSQREAARTAPSSEPQVERPVTQPRTNTPSRTNEPVRQPGIVVTPRSSSGGSGAPSSTESPVTQKRRVIGKDGKESTDPENSGVSTETKP